MSSAERFREMQDQVGSTLWKLEAHWGCPTVDGRDPAPPWMVETLKIMGQNIYQLGISSIHSSTVLPHYEPTSPLFEGPQPVVDVHPQN